MLATRCSCGFETLNEEEVTDHLLAVFETEDTIGNDGQAHLEDRRLSCSCGFSGSSAEELDAHFLAVFTPVGSVARDGAKHEAAA
ncbi:MAG TPA: hypothetical protein VI365_14720 [Trebonia sp.]